MTQLKAAARLSAATIVEAAAGADTFKYGDGFNKMWKRDAGSETRTMRTVNGPVLVGLIPEDELEGDGLQDLQNEVPNIEVRLAGKPMLLTWNEALNLAEMLNGVVRVAYYG